MYFFYGYPAETQVRIPSYSRNLATMIGLISVPIVVMTYCGVSIPTAHGFHPKLLSNFFPPLHTQTDSISAGVWGNFSNLIHARKGDNREGIGRLKQYLRAFGYLNSDGNNNINMTECYDDDVESAVKLYQQSFGLPVTGNLDAETLSQIMIPRCGVEDTVKVTSTVFNGSNGINRYSFFKGRPVWSADRRNLTYAFSPANETAGMSEADLRAVFARAFNRWAAAIPVTFRETGDYRSADIKIGFFRGEHGDRRPFDGVLGRLAHAFSPEDGRLHLDAAESWTTNLGEGCSAIAIDVESVAAHEIGHILGLRHSGVRKAVMYPSIAPRTRKVDLAEDDVRGAQALYGSNPHFRPNLASSTATEQVIETGDGPPLHTHSFYLSLFLFSFWIL